METLYHLAPLITGDLVETSYMIQGLMTIRQYFDQYTAEEDSIRILSTQIIDEVEWDWYRRYPTEITSTGIGHQIMAGK
ncbi:MAG: hypothetical protein IPH11_12235 [Ignavibacteriales bacterium]|nr:hypothetical protein [Ignavibacteriales bacterium]